MSLGYWPTECCLIYSLNSYGQLINLRKVSVLCLVSLYLCSIRTDDCTINVTVRPSTINGFFPVMVLWVSGRNILSHIFTLPGWVSMLQFHSFLNCVQQTKFQTWCCIISDTNRLLKFLFWLHANILYFRPPFFWTEWADEFFIIKKKKYRYQFTFENHFQAKCNVSGKEL